MSVASPAPAATDRIDVDLAAGRVRDALAGLDPPRVPAVGGTAVAR
ncbi:hypothetical protein [Micromonospora sp. NPDC047074]